MEFLKDPKTLNEKSVAVLGFGKAWVAMWNLAEHKGTDPIVIDPGAKVMSKQGLSEALLSPTGLAPFRMWNLWPKKSNKATQSTLLCLSFT